MKIDLKSQNTSLDRIVRSSWIEKWTSMFSVFLFKILIKFLIFILKLKG